jgi:MFS superfamily sulfate permease-like transporter
MKTVLRRPYHTLHRILGAILDLAIVLFIVFVVTADPTTFSDLGEATALSAGIVLALVRLVREYIEYRTVVLEKKQESNADLDD